MSKPFLNSKTFSPAGITVTPPKQGVTKTPAPPDTGQVFAIGGTLQVKRVTASAPTRASVESPKDGELTRDIPMGMGFFQTVQCKAFDPARERPGSTVLKKRLRRAEAARAKAARAEAAAVALLAAVRETPKP
jgi:hypothetical protein